MILAAIQFAPAPKTGRRPACRGWGADALAAWALRLGNIETSASVSLELRAGRNIPNDFGSYSIRPGAENRPPSSLSRLAETRPDSSRAPRPGIHAFLNMEAKAVGWDFSLDGNLFRKSHSVDRKPLVAQAAAGFSSQWIVGGHGMRLAFMRVWRTREFGQQSERAHSFGSVAFSMDFSRRTLTGGREKWWSRGESNP